MMKVTSRVINSGIGALLFRYCYCVQVSLDKYANILDNHSKDGSLALHIQNRNPKTNKNT